MKDGEQSVSADKVTRRVVWVLVSMMTASFVFGISYFLPEEHRAWKLDETMAKYQARRKAP